MSYQKVVSVLFTPEWSNRSVKVRRLEIEGFRGIEHAVLLPRDHVLLTGEPGAGRSDTIHALARVLLPNSTRSALEVWDFHALDLHSTIKVEVVLGDLGDELEQRFVRQLEVWDRSANALVSRADPEDVAPDVHELVLRLAYVARWLAVEEVGEHFVCYPKRSNPSADQWVRVARADRIALPFLLASPARPLQIRVEGDFRRLLDQIDRGEGDLAVALKQVTEGVEELMGHLSGHPAVVAGLEAVLNPLEDTLELNSSISDVVRFAPDGGSVAGLLRGLEATIDLGDGPGFLPLRRHGSTLSSQLAGAEAIAIAAEASAIVAWDDFGEGLDAFSAEYMASLLRTSCAQAWLSTRRSEVGRAFQISEMVRLTRSGGRGVHQIEEPVSRPARVAARQAQLQLMPAITARVVAACEGTQDVTALNALAARRSRSDGVPPPSARGLRFIDSGGVGQVAPVVTLARTMGFRTVAVLDHDKPGADADAMLDEVADAAGAAVRLPERFAIERAIVHGVDPAALREAMGRLKDAFELPWPAPESITDDELPEFLIERLKRPSLHEPFINELPAGVEPPVLAALLEAVVELALSGAIETRTLAS